MVSQISITSADNRSQLLAEIKDGTAKECFATHLCENREEYGLNDHETMFAGKNSLSRPPLPKVLQFLKVLRNLISQLWVCAYLVLNAIEGGSDTTRATLNLLTAAMATHPDFVERARKELDAICGDARRLPTFEDQAKLPLVTAVIKETLRWKPFVESGILHFRLGPSLSTSSLFILRSQPTCSDSTPLPSSSLNSPFLLFFCH